ncbi:hypothetical protein LC55x_2709 [Lysobacter capsici]|nr:hypothetical protein LC55x_2709 [Lysobacter capsici]
MVSARRVLLSLKGRAIRRKCFQSTGLCVFKRRGPPLSCQDGDHFGRIPDCEPPFLGLKAFTQPLPPGF